MDSRSSGILQWKPTGQRCRAMKWVYQTLSGKVSDCSYLFLTNKRSVLLKDGAFIWAAGPAGLRWLRDENFDKIGNWSTVRKSGLLDFTVSLWTDFMINAMFEQLLSDSLAHKHSRFSSMRCLRWVLCVGFNGAFLCQILLLCVKKKYNISISGVYLFYCFCIYIILTLALIWAGHNIKVSHNLCILQLIWKQIKAHYITNLCVFTKESVPWITAVTP